MKLLICDDDKMCIRDRWERASSFFAGNSRVMVLFMGISFQKMRKLLP